MLVPVSVLPGILLDARGVVLSMAAVFGGPLVAFVAGVMAGAGRLWIGGAGMWSGLGIILVSILLGLAYLNLHRRGWIGIGPSQLWCLGFLVQTLNFLLVISIPGLDPATIFTQFGIAMFIVMPIATVILGTILGAIAQRREADSALRSSEAKLRAITEAIQDVLLVIDAQGNYLKIASSFPSDDSDKERLLGKSIHDTLAPNEAEKLISCVRKSLITDAPQVVEYSWHSTSGLKFLEAYARRIDTPIDGKPAAAVFVRDVSEHVRNEVKLRIAATAFESQSGIIITDEKSTILRANSAFCNITGYSLNEIIGKTPKILLSGKQCSKFYRAMWSEINKTGKWKGEVWNRRKNGDLFLELLSINSIRNNSGEITNYVASLIDITEQKAAEDRIKQLAYYDELTGLPNRRLFMDRLERAIAASARSEKHVALLFLDLDNFKNINDLHGHQIGDKTLTVAATRISSTVRANDTVARLGGDEFMIILEGFSTSAKETAEQAKRISHDLLAALVQPYDIEKLQLRSSASIGLVIFNDATCTTEELMRRADLAMYAAKSTGKNQVQLFEPCLQEALSARIDLEEDIRRGLLAGEFVAYFQPQVDSSGNLLGAEVLARWKHPQRGTLAPASFIEAAERAELIAELDLLMLKQACHLLATWRNHPGMSRLSLSVNISARLLYQPNFVEELICLIKQSNTAPSRLKLEITESLLLDDLPAAKAHINSLKYHGIRFALDDFGTGYSSLLYLQQLPLNQLKIDRSFVKGLPCSKSSTEIVRAICALGNSLNLEVIAEGVETEDQLATLIAKGCHRFQGYLFGRPMPLDGFEILATKTRNAPSVIENGCAIGAPAPYEHRSPRPPGIPIEAANTETLRQDIDQESRQPAIPKHIAVPAKAPQAMP